MTSAIAVTTVYRDGRPDGTAEAPGKYEARELAREISVLPAVDHVRLEIPRFGGTVSEYYEDGQTVYTPSRGTAR